VRKLVQSRLSARRALIDEAHEYVTALGRKVEIVAAVIAGSVARGDYHDGSDIDVVIVSDQLPSHPLKRAELLWSVDLTRVEPKGFTRAEFVERLRRGDPLICETVEQGYVLLDPEGFIAKLRVPHPSK